MLTCYQREALDSLLPITLVTRDGLADWSTEQSLQLSSWVESIGFKAEPGSFCLLSDQAGRLSGVLAGVGDEDSLWDIGDLSQQLPDGIYYLANDLSAEQLQQALISWGLGAYQFTYYKKAKRSPVKLFAPKGCHIEVIENIVESTYLVRDLINTPAEDMGPLELASIAAKLAEQFNATATQIVGEDLLDEVYPAIYTVGRGSYNVPRLIDLEWGELTDPKVTLVGKGVCYDTGGLNLKPANGMRLMKKDMGGAAHVLGLARMIMAAQLPIRLRVLIPAVENAISGDAFRPGDIITMRNGKTVEVDNTDAEGRLILADALVEACTDKPDLLIDFATLTGAARVAVGTEIAALFTDNKQIAARLDVLAEQENDPIWRMPLFQPYLKLLDSKFADYLNCSPGGYGGAITAALFLQQFVDKDIPWMHFDVMGYNITSRPGRPQGGEAMGLRAVFHYLRQRFSPKH